MLRSPLSVSHVALAAVILALSATACDKTKPPPGDSAPSPADGGKPPPADPPADARKLAVPDDHPMFGRYEGSDFPNDCKADTDCHTGGCGGEVCSADPGVMSMCEVPPAPLPAGTQCGCVEAQCRWWNTDGATLSAAADPPAAEPTPDGDCGGQVCTPPQQCLEYYGVAGARGPKLRSCEIPCDPAKGGCPAGQTCTTVADGPGSVCR